MPSTRSSTDTTRAAVRVYGADAFAEFETKFADGAEAGYRDELGRIVELCALYELNCALAAAALPDGAATTVPALKSWDGGAAPRAPDIAKAPLGDSSSSSSSSSTAENSAAEASGSTAAETAALRERLLAAEKSAGKYRSTANNLMAKLVAMKSKVQAGVAKMKARLDTEHAAEVAVLKQELEVARSGSATTASRSASPSEES
jgi:hypothetical protein